MFHFKLDLNFLTKCFLLVLMVFLASCVTEPAPNSASIRYSEAAVISVQDPSMTIAKGASFAWLPEAVHYYKDERLADTPVKQAIELEIMENVQAQGMQVLNSVEQSQYGIAYTAALESALDDYAIIRKFGLLPGYAQMPQDDTEVEKGILIIYVFDNKAKDIVWRSAAQVGVAFDMSMSERRARIKRVVAEMFGTFPVTQ